MKAASIRTYFRELFEYFPSHALQARRAWGLTGLGIASAAYVLRFAPGPIQSIIGPLRIRGELLNFLDNFCANELRCEEVERYLEGKPSATVVDLGVNVGVSARWWLTRSPGICVIGIDMIRESLAFTSQRIAELGFSDRWVPIESAVGEKAGTARIHLSDPLEGTTTLTATQGSEIREVQIETLDHLLAKVARIDLLKVDIEGHGGLALQGAEATLAKARYVCVETHSDTETELCGRVLDDRHFVLIKLGGRHGWWRKGLVDSDSEI